MQRIIANIVFITFAWRRDPSKSARRRRMQDLSHVLKMLSFFDDGARRSRCLDILFPFTNA